MMSSSKSKDNCRKSKVEYILFYCLLSIVLCPTALRAQVTIADTTYYVLITYSGNTATVEMTDDVKSYVSASVDGAHVTITSTASAAVNEITYGLAGSTTNGSFTFNGSYKATVELFGVTLTNPAGPAIDIQNGKRIEISAKKETVSTLTDGTSTEESAWKGALYCKGHIEFKGKGTLNVYGNYAHAIKAGEYIEMKNCTINVYSAVKDAINCNQYFLMESGEINLSGFGDDGIQVDMEDNDTSAENTANFTMTGGTININMTGAAGESVKAEGVQSVASEASLNLSTGIEDVKSARMLGNKVLLDGKVLIKKNNQLFTLTGHEIQ
mgnify:CR=1 FL=1